MLEIRGKKNNAICFASQIDEKALEQAKKRAEEALEEKLTDEEYAYTVASLEKTLAQLKVKRRHRSS